MRTLLLVVFAFQAASLLGAREISGDYTVSVDGRPVEVIRVPTPERAYSPLLKEPYSYAMFTSDGACEVTVRWCAAAKSISRQNRIVSVDAVCGF